MSTAPGLAPSVPSKLNRGIELCADEAMDIAIQSAMMWQRIFRKPRFPTLPAFRLGLDARASSTNVLGFDIGKPRVSDSGFLLATGTPGENAMLLQSSGLVKGPSHGSHGSSHGHPTRPRTISLISIKVLIDPVPGISL